ncbi:MAG: hypothetical protein ACK417_08475 [Bacteroidia bacterium]
METINLHGSVWIVAVRTLIKREGAFFNRPPRRFPTFFLLLLSLALAFLLNACSKDKSYIASIQGQVLTLGTNQVATSRPLRMGLYERVPTKGFLTPSAEVLIHEFYCEPDGSYAIQHKLEQNPHRYFVKLLEEPDNHYLIYEQADLYSRDKNEVNLYAHPTSWLDLTIDNSEGNSTDKFAYIFGFNIRRYFGATANRDVFQAPGEDSLILIMEDHRYDPFRTERIRLLLPAWDTLHMVYTPKPYEP